MRKRICLLLLTFCLLLSACNPVAQPDPDATPDTSAPEETAPEALPTPEEPELSQRERDWLEDIEFLREQYKEKHINPFYYRPEAEFDSRLDLLEAKVGKLTDNEIFFELSAAVVAMGDLHSRVLVPDSLYERLFPFDIRFFGDRLYLVDHLEGFEELSPYLLREIVAVNGVDIAYLQRKAESVLLPANSWYSKECFSSVFGLMAGFYDWATGLDARETYTFQFLNENQQVESVEVPVISEEEYRGAEWVYPEELKTVPVMFRGDSAVYEDRSGGCVYLALDSMLSIQEDTYRELFEKAAKLLEEHPDCRKLAIDLRGNPGGYSVAFEHLRKYLYILKELPFEQVYVMTNGYTASMATRCLTLFEKELNAVKVGEPTGQFTSFFMFTTSMSPVAFTLPHSQLSVQVSTGWAEGDNPENTVLNKMHRLYEWENTILPDVYVYQDIEDIRQGKDSVLEWVLAQ